MGDRGWRGVRAQPSAPLVESALVPASRSFASVLWLCAVDFTVRVRVVSARRTGQEAKASPILCFSDNLKCYTITSLLER